LLGAAIFAEEAGGHSDNSSKGRLQREGTSLAGGENVGEKHTTVTAAHVEDGRERVSHRAFLSTTFFADPPLLADSPPGTPTVAPTLLRGQPLAPILSPRLSAIITQSLHCVLAPFLFHTLDGSVCSGVSSRQSCRRQHARCCCSHSIHHYLSCGPTMAHRQAHQCIPFLLHRRHNVW
jgi:hypothetical protein